MKVLLYTEREKVVGKSGLGKAIKHQIKALEITPKMHRKELFHLGYIGYRGKHKRPVKRPSTA